MTQMVACGATGNCSGGIRKGTEVLQLLDVPFSLKGGKARTIVEFLRLKRLLSRTSEEDIMKLPEMTDQRVLAALQILHLMFVLLQPTDFQLAPLAAFRMVRLTLKHGLSPLGMFYRF